MGKSLSYPTRNFARVIRTSPYGSDHLFAFRIGRKAAGVWPLGIPTTEVFGHDRPEGPMVAPVRSRSFLLIVRTDRIVTG